MEKWTNINTGLDHFLLLGGISEAGQDRIRGTFVVSENQTYLGVEALAQLGAMHVRFITDFSGHAVLLSIHKCDIRGEIVRNSRFFLSGKLLSRSSRGFLYSLKADSEDGTLIAGEFLFAIIPYDRQFKQECIEGHYRKVFSCLKNGS